MKRTVYFLSAGFFFLLSACQPQSDIAPLSTNNKGARVTAGIGEPYSTPRPYPYPRPYPDYIGHFDDVTALVKGKSPKCYVSIKVIGAAGKLELKVTNSQDMIMDQKIVDNPGDLYSTSLLMNGAKAGTEVVLEASTSTQKYMKILMIP